MHSIQLAELANTYTHRAAAMLALGCVPRREAIHALWLTHRFRHESWSQRLATHRNAINTSGLSVRTRAWHQIIPVIQEILVSEPLTRCLAYHAAAFHLQPRENDFMALMHSSLVSHVEARNRCLNLIVFGQGLAVEHVVRLNRLRRSLELFNDFVLAPIPPVEQLERFAFDLHSVTKIQNQLLRTSINHWRLHESATQRYLTDHIRPDLDGRIASPRLNHRISQSVLELFPVGLFDSFGVAKSSWSASLTADSPESSGSMHDMAGQLPHPLNLLFGRSDQHTVPETSQERRW
jgi:hypothetical protein